MEGVGACEGCGLAEAGSQDFCNACPGEGGSSLH